MTMQSRAKQDLSMKLFGDVNLPGDLGVFTLFPPSERQYILRMMVRNPLYGQSIPDELSWVKPLFASALKYQRENFVDHPFAYITVRHGLVNSSTDDLWHTDGFSVKKPHGPEQNYVWCDGSPTQFLNQSFTFPADFDPMLHNVHEYFQDHAKDEAVVSGDAQHIYVMDPYVVHRRNPENTGTIRTFVRVSFVPIEIEDNKNTPNPAFPKVTFTNRDLRLDLVRYGNKTVD